MAAPKHATKDLIRRPNGQYVKVEYGDGEAVTGNLVVRKGNELTPQTEAWWNAAVAYDPADTGAGEAPPA